MAYKKYFTLSYDDGVQTDKRFLDVINAYGLKCTFNLNSGLMTPTKQDTWHLSHEEIPELYKGHEVATHGYSHPWYNKIAPEEIEDDIAKDIKLLSEITGYPVLGHAYPFGAWTEATLDIFAKHGIRYARTIKSTLTFDIPQMPLLLDPTCHHSDPNVFGLIEQFVNAEPTDGDMLFYMWGHTYEFNYTKEYNSWEHLEKVCKMISGKNDIVYCTNMEFFDRNK